MFKHPKGLYFLFFTEMWERFSYYGMRALLIYYMVKHLMMPQAEASHIYGLYTGFVYFTPFFGGILADRYLGQRKSVILGGTLMAIGHFLMAFEFLFYPALIFLIFGNGAFKPNISTQVGSLYAADDPRRDSAFSLFYVGINLGALFSPLICGYLGEKIGWHYGFAAAGVGMVLGLIVYILGQKHLAPDNIMMKKAAMEIKPRDEKISPEEKSKIFALIFLCVINILFWGVYEQQGNTLALWADTQTDRMIFGWEMPASWYQSFNPAMIIGFTPILAMIWDWLAKKGIGVSSITKMAIGCFLLGFAFVLLIPAARINAATGQAVSLWWLTGVTFLLTIGELYLSPVGLSLVTKLAPVRLVSMLMGMWFLSSFFGNYLSGYLGTFWEKMPKESFFILMSAFAFAAGLAFLFAKKFLKEHLKGLSEAQV